MPFELNKNNSGQFLEFFLLKKAFTVFFILHKIAATSMVVHSGKYTAS